MMSFYKINTRLVNKSEVARRLGISAAYVSMLFSGKRKSKKYEQKIRQIIRSNAA